MYIEFVLGTGKHATRNWVRGRRLRACGDGERLAAAGA
jgi:hypothetical protein